MLVAFRLVVLVVAGGREVVGPEAEVVEGGREVGGPEAEEVGGGREVGGPEAEVVGGGRVAGGPRGGGGGPRGCPSAVLISGAFFRAVMWSLDLDPSLYSMKEPVMSRSLMTYSGVRLTSFLFLRSSSMTMLSMET